MKNLKEFKNIKVYTNILQRQRLELITDFVLYEYQIKRADLFSKTRKRVICEARRKIAFLARLHFNIEGRTIARYLNIKFESVCQLIYSAWDYCTVDSGYYVEIQGLMKKLQMHYNVSISPLI